VLASKRFESLASNSSIQGEDLVDNCPVDMPRALCPLKVQPYGTDPVFNPFSSIFDEDLPGLDANYYNITTVSAIYSVCVPHGFGSTPICSHAATQEALSMTAIRCRLMALVLTKCCWQMQHFHKSEYSCWTQCSMLA